MSTDRSIGILAPFFSHPAFIQRMRGIIDGLDESGDEYNMVLFHVRTPEQIEYQISRILRTHLVEGLIVNALPLSEQQLERFAREHIAVVRILDRPLLGTPTIGIDNRLGGRLATEHLIGLGHTKIGFVGEFLEDPFNFPTATERQAGYQEALQAHGLALNPHYLVYPDRSPLSTLQAARRLLSLPEPPTAIFAMYDEKALHVIQTINDIGLKIPDFVSVIGFDDIDAAHHLGLTTVRQHFERCGQLAAQMLLRLLVDDPSWQDLCAPQLELVVRETTAPPDHFKI
jgi:DNA-binding LacI/PurR family transcriptional regulator